MTLWYAGMPMQGAVSPPMSTTLPVSAMTPTSEPPLMIQERVDCAAEARPCRNMLLTAAPSSSDCAAPVTLTPTEMRLLHFLASHPGRVFPRSHLLSRVIGEDAIVTDRNIDVHVRALRQKLGEHAAVIETVRGVGYRFAEAQ